MCGSGWIKIYRSIWKRDWSPAMREVFLYLLCDVNFYDDELKRGETKTSYGSLSKAVGFSKQIIRTALSNLEKNGTITVEASKKGLLISVINYDKYQGELTHQSTHDLTHQSTHDLTHEQNLESGINSEFEGGNKNYLTHDLTHESTHKLTHDLTPHKEYIKNNKESKRSNRDSSHYFVIPTISLVREYCTERNNDIDAEEFVDFYTARGWMIGKTKMKDWKAAIRTWERSRMKQNKAKEDLPF